MATNASKSVGKKTTGPKGTASQRATKQGKIKGRQSAAGKSVKKG
jgi:hypothetical protein